MYPGFSSKHKKKRDHFENLGADGENTAVHLKEDGNV
jgi:hypothetical protein